MHSGGSVPRARASPIASATPKPCEETEPDGTAASVTEQSMRWTVPGGAPDCAASITQTRRNPCNSARTAVASPSCSTIRTVAGTRPRSRRATMRPTASSPRSQLPMPSTAVAKDVENPPPPLAGGGWGEGAIPAAPSPPPPNFTSPTHHFQLQKMRRAGNAGIVVPHRLLAAHAQRLLRHIQPAAGERLQIVLDTRLVL